MVVLGRYIPHPTRRVHPHRSRGIPHRGTRGTGVDLVWVLHPLRLVPLILPVIPTHHRVSLLEFRATPFFRMRHVRAIELWRRAAPRWFAVRVERLGATVDLV